MTSTILGFLALSAMLLAIVWAVLSSDAFNKARSALIQQALSEKIGYPLIINGDARVVPGLRTKLVLTDVSMPSFGIDGVNLAELAEVSLVSDTMDLLFGEPDFQALNISGLTINLLSTEDNFVSWSDAPTAVRGNEDVARTAVKAVDQAYWITTLSNFILSRSDAFTDVNLNIVNEKTGFVFDFTLDKIQFEHSGEGTGHRVSSVGAVNDVGFEFAGEFARVGPFDIHAQAGSVILNYAGTRRSVDEGGGFEGRFNLHAADISTFLDIMQLDTTYPGSIWMSANVENDGHATAIRDFSAALNFTSGTEITAFGSVDDLQRVQGIDINLGGRFYAEGRPPPAAGNFSELQLIEATGRITGDHEAFIVEDAVLKTNAFEEEIEEFGPIGIGQMRRSESNKLELLDVTLQAGLPDDPFLQVTGRVGDALEISDYAFTGQIAAPTAILLAGLDPLAASRFGTITGTFAIDDAPGFPRLPSMDIKTSNTDLWALDLDARSGASDHAPQLEIDAQVRVADTEVFLDGLGLARVDVSPIEFGMEAEATVSSIAAAFDVRAGRSRIDSVLNFEVEDYTRRLTGLIESEELHVVDIQRLIALGIEAAKVDLLTAAAERPDQTIVVQPLILPEQEITLAQLLAQDGVQPLMLPAPQLKDIFSFETIMRHVDAKIDIAVDALRGAPGVSGVNGRLTAQQGVAQFGPLEARFGGGFLKAQANMDLIETPDILEVSGTTGGWNFGKMLDSVGVDIRANGVLNGSFGLKGPWGSLREFADAMAGAVDITMSNGSIDTSLLELAGLGVVPWLFTQEMFKGRTTIACLTAPLNINAGHVTFDHFVAETKRVQVVAKGSFDWRRDSVNIRAEPRPLGQPLARSAFPVAITGKLSDPAVRSEGGGGFRLLPRRAYRTPPARVACVPDSEQLR